MNRYLFAGVVGLISGLFSYFSAISFGEFGMLYFPGIIFGLVIIFFLYSQKYPLFSYKYLFFIIFSTISYYVAVRVTITLLDVVGQYAAFFLGGFMGALLLFISYAVFIYSINYKKILISALCGGVLGLSWFIIPEGILFASSSYGPALESFLSLYLFWQAGIVICIANITTFDKKNK